MPDFIHDYSPAGAGPGGSKISLDTREIEDAGVYEILQTPGAALGSWSILNQLLEPIADFRFKEPLGQSREVKTALSGLFGRFVARAYATRYLGLNYFAHIHSPPMALAGGLGTVKRSRGKTGDLPDWAAWGVAGGLAIVEAKGSHDKRGPGPRLGSAYEQAKRATIVHGRKRATFKRYAIATRWGCTMPAPTPSMLYVKDPAIEGETSEQEQCELALGIARRHFASLLAPLGQREVAAALIKLIHSSTKDERDAASKQAVISLKSAPRSELEEANTTGGALIGGVVARGGPLELPKLAPADQETLIRLQQRPVFVGVDERMVEAVIEGSMERIQQLRAQAIATQPGSSSRATTDSAGSWTVRMYEDPEDAASS